jgi:ABC-type Fe3+/spermidine/putrescine transport system ATPase subunit
MEMGQPSAAEAVGVLEAVTIANCYAIVPVLKGVDCRLRPGRIHTVIGENGAGRSTLFKILSGLFPPTSGALQFDGGPLILALSHSARQWGVYLVPQEPALMVGLTVAETMFVGQLPNSGRVPFRRLDWAAAQRRGPLRGGFASGLSSMHKPAGTGRQKWTPFSILAMNWTQFHDDSADIWRQTTVLSLRSSARSVWSSVQRPRRRRVFRNRASRRSWTAALFLRNERGDEELGRRDLREE